MRVTVASSDAPWPTTSASVQSELVAALRDVVGVTIEHVGSTAVPGLAAKPVSTSTWSSPRRGSRRR